jgi:hypothetical protein
MEPRAGQSQGNQICENNAALVGHDDPARRCWADHTNGAPGSSRPTDEKSNSSSRENHSALKENRRSACGAPPALYQK